jgi:hypothetical protein
MIYCVVTGTRRDTRPDTARWLARFVRKHGGTTFVLGDADGVDELAWHWCTQAMIDGFGPVDFIRETADRKRPTPERFHERNQRMVDEAKGRAPQPVCLAIPDDDSRGTWDCYLRALAAGLVCHALPLVDEDWKVVKRFEMPSWARQRLLAAGVR